MAEKEKGYSDGEKAAASRTAISTAQIEEQQRRIGFDDEQKPLRPNPFSRTGVYRPPRRSSSHVKGPAEFNCPIIPKSDRV